MKIAAFITIVVFAMSSTSFAATCGTRNKSTLFKNTAATTSNIAATQSNIKVASTQRAVQ
ncbi:hypothetical protein ACLVWU_00580 [Bdellovibrio sp. HCB290]|uniref:hypothetical protein n=1 Tax=Bdellovibrio sp. HCB290 TaxID=3394356 RepID=UPI0039B4A044